MTLLEKPQKIMTRSPSLDSFEETYKTAYSHGLEAIYAIETVDLKTIRKIQDVSFDPQHLQQVEQHASPVFIEEPQYEFDFGELYRDWTKPLFLREPIQVLGLSSQAEASLLGHGKNRVEDLIESDLRSCVLGQGHLDEIQKKLKTFINGRSIKRAYTIEFKSLILSLIVGMNFKKAALFLKDFTLSDIVPLNLAEKMEIRSFDPSKDENWNQGVFWEFHEKRRLEGALEWMQKFAHLFVIPWIRSRGGMATKMELLERLEKVSENPLHTHLAIEFLSVVYSQGNFPFAQFLFEPEKNLFLSDEHLEEAFRDVVRRGKSYFYSSTVFYPLEQLVSFLSREFVKNWKQATKEFIRSCLRHSAVFNIRRTQNGRLEITLN